MGLDMYLYKVKAGDENRPKLKWGKKFNIAEVHWPDGKVELVKYRHDAPADYPDGDWVYTFYNIDTDELIDTSDYADYEFNEFLYWRKFNALHGWFVDHYDGEEDDCEPHSVSVDDMLSLIDVLEKVMSYKKYLKPVKDADNNEDGYWKEITDDKICIKLDELLGTLPGFFFGSTSYDTWYFNDVEETLAALKEAEEDMKSGKIEKFIYRASW